jgi:hypothetical protein
LFVTALYVPPYRTDFVGDDFVQLGFIAEFLDRPATAYQVLHPTWTTWYYRPVQNLWFLANRLTFSLNPFGYYWLQALWHALTIALVYRLARSLRLPGLAALAGAMLFALNLHHHDVVAWISSIAIIQGAAISVLAVICYLAYLDRPAHKRYLLATAALTFLVLTIHEEGLLLLPFLVTVRLTDRRRPVSRPEWVALGLLTLANAIYVIIQFTRPNLTIDVGESGLAHYLPFLNPAEISRFFIAVAGRWTLLDSFSWGRSLLALLAVNTPAAILFSAGLLLLIGYWFVRGSRPVRLGLIWLALHLGFIYLALWSQRPDLFAGRHLYSAWIGVCVAVAGSIAGLGRRTADGKQPFLNRRPGTGDRGRPIADRSLQNTVQRWWSGIQAKAWHLFFLVLAVFLGVQAGQVGRVHETWLARAAEMRRAEAQMKALLPELAAEQAVFAHRFVMNPGFLPFTLAVWYDRPQVTGGSLNKLRTNAQFREVTDDYYILDYADGRLYNLLPELQEASPAILLWHDRPEAVYVAPDGTATPLSEEQVREDVVAGPAGMPRLTTQVQPTTEGWAALGYRTVVPPGAELAVQVWGPPGANVRVRVTNPAGVTKILHAETLLATAESSWHTIQLPLTAYPGQTVTIWLEAGTADTTLSPAVYWANPRLILPDSNTR